MITFFLQLGGEFMARKQRKLYSLDEGIVQEFEKVCKKKDLEFSAAVQQLMEQYIAQDGQIMLDDLYAPRINELVKRTVVKEVDRIASMMYNLQVDVTANLYSIPAMYKKSLGSVENTFNEYLNPQLLNPNRVSAAQQFEFNKDGQAMISNLRNFARNDMKQKKKTKEEMI
jgi:hypothetical protein